MSLFGAMFAGVSGLNAQSKKIGNISDNIANVSTVGYKRADTQFENLVISTGSRGGSPGGALPITRYDITRAGTVLGTSVATDIAISGEGFFIVRDDGSDAPLYTRAGSFRTDETGNLVNAQGFTLMGWPLDSSGRLPGEPGNLNTTAYTTTDSLETVNINVASGLARPTSEITVKGNMDSSAEVYAGAAISGGMDELSSVNADNDGDDIIVSSEYGMSTLNSVVRGDRMTITTGNGIENTFEYGGFAVGRKVTLSGALNVGDGGTVITPRTLAAGDLDTSIGTQTVTLTVANHNLQTGATVTLAGLVTTGGIPAAQLNTAHTVTVIDANTVSFDVTTPATATASNAGAATANIRQFSGNVLDAQTATQAFLGNSGISNFSTDALKFSINTNTTGTRTFTYVAGSPNASAGQFNSLNTLADAIDRTAGLTARVVDGRLVVGAEDANEAITFTNGDIDGNSTSPAKQGIDWVTELDLTNVTASTDRFNTLQGLYNLAQAASGISSTLENPTSNATLSINVDDPLDTLTIRDYVQSPVTALGANPVTITGAGPAYTVTIADATHSYAVGDKVVLADIAAFNGFTAAELNGTVTITAVSAGASFSYSVTPAGAVTTGTGGGTVATRASTNSGSLLAELGMVTSLNGGAYSPQVTTTVGPKYDASGVSGQNIASGDITPEFKHPIRIYDALGTGHDVNVQAIKVNTNEWAVEVFINPADDISSTLPNGQIATGFITFNGDGTLRSVSAELENAIPINWTNGSSQTEVTIDWGTAGPPLGTLNSTVFGKNDGIGQIEAASLMDSATQNGSPAGYLIGVEINKDGQVIASFSNGKSQALYQLPLADFANPNGLRPISGNVYSETQDSGSLNMRAANTSGMGEIKAGALESSNVDLASELTDMIVAQRAYQSNTRVISTADELLQQLANLGN